MQTDQIHRIRIQITRVSRVHVQVTSRLIKLKAAKLRIQEQTRTEKGAKVQRNKRQNTTRLSFPHLRLNTGIYPTSHQTREQWTLSTSSGKPVGHLCYVLEIDLRTKFS